MQRKITPVHLTSFGKTRSIDYLKKRFDSREETFEKLLNSEIFRPSKSLLEDDSFDTLITLLLGSGTVPKLWIQILSLFL